MTMVPILTMTMTMTMVPILAMTTMVAVLT